MFIQEAFVREFMPVITLILLAVILNIDSYTSITIRKKFKILILLEFIEIIVFELELWTHTFTTFHISRLILSIIGYTLRPILIASFVVIVSKKSYTKTTKLILFIPAIINFLIMSSALYCPIAFSFSNDNIFHRGPLGNTTHITATIYYLILIYHCFKERNEREKSEQWILWIASIFLIIITCIDVPTDLGLLRPAVTITTFAFYFSVQTRNQLSLIDALSIMNNRNSIVISQSNKNIFLYNLKTSELQDQSGIVNEFGLPVNITIDDSIFFTSNIVLKDSQKDMKQFFQDMKNGIYEGKQDFHLQKADGRKVWVECNYTLQKDNKGNNIYSVISCSDVTIEHEKEQELEKGLSAIAQFKQEHTFYLEGSLQNWKIDEIEYSEFAQNRDLHIVDATGMDINQALFSILKDLIIPEDQNALMEFLQQDRIQLLYLKDVYSDSMSFRIQENNEITWRYVELHILKVASFEDSKVLIVFKNDNGLHHAQETLERRANYDALTGLYSRSAVMAEIEHFLMYEGKNGTHALLMLDMDNLKAINDTLGHQIGDAALKRFSDTVNTVFRKNDIKGRIGGDEFFVLMKNIDKVVLNKKINQFLPQLEFSFHNDTHTVSSTASIGVALYDGTKDKKPTLNELYANADQALYKSKRTGKNKVTIHE